MKFRKCCSQFLKVFDLFSLTQFLRYKEDEDYKTVSGGVISLIVVTIFLALFASHAISTVSKTEVAWQLNIEKSFQPKGSTFSFNADSKQMFALGVVGMNLNNPNFRYFDVEMIQTEIINETFTELSRIPMVPCTIDHFSMTQKMKSNFVTMRAQRKVCPPLNYSFNVEGRFTNNQVRNMEIRLSQCNSSWNVSRPCMNQTIINSIFTTAGQLYANLLIINPLINPGNTQYIDYYIQDKNFVAFSNSLGAYSVGYAEDYTIETDQSLLPFTATHTEQGIIFAEPFSIVPFMVTNTKYARFYIMKSSSKTTYKRSFNKIDQFFSYVGGLIGTILGLMFFMEKFSLMSFELDIAQDFFRGKNDEKMDFSTFNIFSYFRYLFYQVGSYFGFCKSWKKVKEEVTCKDEMVKQLDVRLLLQRFNFLERAVESLLKCKQISESQLYQPQNLSALKRRRRKYRQCKKIRRQNQENEKGSDESTSSSQSEGDESETPEDPNIDSSLKNIQEQEFSPEKRKKRRRESSGRVIGRLQRESVEYKEERNDSEYYSKVEPEKIQTAGNKRSNKVYPQTYDQDELQKKGMDSKIVEQHSFEEFN